MVKTPLRLIVLARDQSRRVQDAWSQLKDFLDHQPGVDVVAAAATEDLDPSRWEADMVVVLGGDGAILRACHQLDRRQLPILGVNLGHLGFLADLSPEEFHEKLPLLQEGNYRLAEHLMFECTLRDGQGNSETCLGLNDVVVSAGASLRMIDVHLRIDGESVTTYSGDGLILSTPVGSTAHSLSAGGPILRHDLQAFVITPICPHTLTNRPLVDHADCVYTLTVPGAQEGSTVVIDGQIHRPITAKDTIEVRRAPVSFKLVQVPGRSYYATLHKKLGWGGGRPRFHG